MYYFLETLCYVGLISFVVGLIWLIFNLTKNRNFRIPVLVMLFGLVFFLGAPAIYAYRTNAKEAAAEAQSRKESSELDSLLSDDTDSSYEDDDSSSSSSEESSYTSLDEEDSSESEASSEVTTENPDITTLFDVKNMDQYTSGELTGKAVSLHNFHIVDSGNGKDKLGEYHYLLSPKDSNALFLVVTDKKLHPDKDGQVTLDGLLNGLGTVNSSQIGAGISRIYEDKDAILFISDF
ncbi:hypothetical protein [uncultured Ligilactobacillus sp.]|uniref:hypothetical protein n=1 Tax=uncultured Ligilactobacillus sp. TaxID=2837633 RepID=UPI002729D943|nr:hypothetical protein [uncultured Ligilactobacillus sp.]